LKLRSIKRVNLIEPVPVYDIEVAVNSNFILSSGLIVHNSKDIADAVAGSIYSAKLNMHKFRANITTQDLIEAMTLHSTPSSLYDQINSLGSTTIFS